MPTPTDLSFDRSRKPEQHFPVQFREEISVPIFLKPETIFVSEWKWLYYFSVAVQEASSSRGLNYKPTYMCPYFMGVCSFLKIMKGVGGG